MTRNTLYYRRVNHSFFCLRTGDIVNEEMDAIVTAANSRLAGGGGVDGAVHRAGGPTIMAQCRQLGGCPKGKAVVTGAGNLKAKILIHAVGPMWSGGQQGEPDLLRSAYQESLRQAVRHQAKSIIFPSISTGAYGYPIAEAALVAVGAVVDFLRQSDQIETAGFILFGSEDYQVYEKAAEQLIDRAACGCFWDFSQHPDRLYLHPLHFNDLGSERSILCAHWLRRLVDDMYWEEDTCRMLDQDDWRDHLSAAVSFYLCPHPHHHPAIIDALWRALNRGSWVSPQLLVVLSQRDPNFAPRLEKLLAGGMTAESSGDRMLDHVAQGPGNDDSRLGKTANAALGLAASGVWEPARSTEARAREFAKHDDDNADDIAVRWLDSVRQFEQLVHR